MLHPTVLTRVTKLFSIPESRIDAHGEATRLGRGSLTGRDVGVEQHSGPGIPGDL